MSLKAVVVLVLNLFALASASLFEAEATKGTTGSYPLSTELSVLERDLTSSDYRLVLGMMIPTDLAAEWQRVATSDNYLVFSEQHGGDAVVNADPALKAAYERRKQIADRFLSLIREAYTKRRLKGPFENRAKLEVALRSAAQRKGANKDETSLAVRPVMPVEGAERQWPRLRGPDGQGTTFDAYLPLHWSPNENIVWKAEVAGRGNSSPVVWNDRIFVTTASADGKDRKILCFSRADGRLFWQYTAPPSTGKEWLYTKNTYASSTPVTDGERVIAFFGSSGLICIDFEGRLQWQVDLGPFPTMHGPGTSPLLYRNEVICIQYQSRGTSLFASFDKRTGKQIWRHEQPKAMCWSTPVILRVNDHDELVYNGSEKLAGYDPLNGIERWHVTGTSNEAIPTVVAGGGRLYSASGRNGPTMAVQPGGRGDVTGSHVLWRNLRGGPHVPSPLYHEDPLYIVNDTGIATCLNAVDGQIVWQRRLPGRFSMSPIAAQRRILVINEAGHATIFAAADKFAVVAENDLDEPVLATPALLGDRLYLRSASHLWCIGPGPGATSSAQSQR